MNAWGTWQWEVLEMTVYETDNLPPSLNYLSSKNHPLGFCLLPLLLEKWIP